MTPDQKPVTATGTKHQHNTTTEKGGTMKARTLYGFKDSERVRDVRDGTTGTVHFLDTADGDEFSGYEEAEVVWDGTAFADGLSLAAPHLTRV